MQPELLEDLDEEVVLRFPPEDPASLVHAALVTKRWCRHIASRGFRRRFRELHGAPPMRGLICNDPGSEAEQQRRRSARLVPTSSVPLPRGRLRAWQALDSRHGRVLLYNFRRWQDEALGFLVWSPVTGEQRKLPVLVPNERFPWPNSFNATLLCARGASCDHVDCHHLHHGHGPGPFLVVLVFTAWEDGQLLLFTSFYSSDTGAWTEPAVAYRPHDDLVDLVPAVPAALLGNALYFVFVHVFKRILKYDLGTRQTSILDMPPTCYGRVILMTSEQGKLGFVRARADQDFNLYLWSMEVSEKGDVVWTQDRVIELQNLLPADALLTSPIVAVGCVHGHGVILVGTGDGFFTVDPKLNQATKVGEGIPCKKAYLAITPPVVVPYTSFFFPALGAISTDEGAGAGESSA